MLDASRTELYKTVATIRDHFDINSPNEEISKSDSVDNAWGEVRTMVTRLTSEVRI